MIYPKSLRELAALLTAYEEEYGLAVDQVEDQMEAVYEAAHQEADKLSEKYKKKLQKLMENCNLAKIVKQVESIQKEMQVIMGGGTPDLEAMGIDLGLGENTAIKGLDEIDPIASFEEAVTKLNVALRDLSTIDLEAMTPAETIEKFGQGKEAGFIIHGGVNEGTYTLEDSGRYKDRSPEGIAGAVCIVWALCQEVLKRAEGLQDIVENACDAGSFSVYIDDCASVWCAARREELSVGRDNLFEELYGQGARAIDPAFFAYYDSARDEACDPYMNNPFAAFQERINLGSVSIRLSDGYADLSTLSPNIECGYYNAPLLLDLKKHGNLFFYVEHSKYDDPTTDFVNQVILQYLAAAPAGKMKLCLVDVENHLSLSPYKILDKVDPSILFKGIIRDDRQLEDTIKDMEQIMYRVSDDVLSYNGVADIFEYNEKFASSPECMHLLVLVNYPSGMNESLNRRLQNIMEHGNRCGIYTMVITCETFPLTSEDVANGIPLFNAVKDTTVSVGYDGGVFVAEGEYDFTPISKTAEKGKVSISRLPALVEQMLGSAKE